MLIPGKPRGKACQVVLQASRPAAVAAVAAAAPATSAWPAATLHAPHSDRAAGSFAQGSRLCGRPNRCLGAMCLSPRHACVMAMEPASREQECKRGMTLG